MACEHVTRTKQAIGYTASQGVPLASIAVPVSGLLAVAGGMSILLGYRAKLAAWLIALLLIRVTFVMHKFWTVADPHSGSFRPAGSGPPCYCPE